MIAQQLDDKDIKGEKMFNEIQNNIDTAMVAFESMFNGTGVVNKDMKKTSNICFEDFIMLQEQKETLLKTYIEMNDKFSNAFLEMKRELEQTYFYEESKGVSKYLVKKKIKDKKNGGSYKKEYADLSADEFYSKYATTNELEEKYFGGLNETLDTIYSLQNQIEKFIMFRFKGLVINQAENVISIINKRELKSDIINEILITLPRKLYVYNPEFSITTVMTNEIDFQGQEVRKNIFKHSDVEQSEFIDEMMSCEDSSTDDKIEIEDFLEKMTERFSDKVMKQYMSALEKIEAVNSKKTTSFAYLAPSTQYAIESLEEETGISHSELRAIAIREGKFKQNPKFLIVYNAIKKEHRSNLVSYLNQSIKVEKKKAEEDLNLKTIFPKPLASEIVKFLDEQGLSAQAEFMESIHAPTVEAVVAEVTPIEENVVIEVAPIEEEIAVIEVTPIEEEIAVIKVAPIKEVATTPVMTGVAIMMNQLEEFKALVNQKGIAHQKKQDRKRKKKSSSINALLSENVKTKSSIKDIPISTPEPENNIEKEKPSLSKVQELLNETINIIPVNSSEEASRRIKRRRKKKTSGYPPANSILYNIEHTSKPEYVVDEMLHVSGDTIMIEKTDSINALQSVFSLNTGQSYANNPYFRDMSTPKKGHIDTSQQFNTVPIINTEEIIKANNLSGAPPYSEKSYIKNLKCA